MEKEFENKLMNLVNDEAVSKESIALTAMDFAKKSTLYNYKIEKEEQQVITGH